MIQVRAEGKNLPISPRKLRLIAKMVRGKELSEALVWLNHLPQKGAKILQKVVSSASANAVNNFKLDKKNLFISQVIVDEGIRHKRLDYSHGARFNGGMIKRRLSRLRVILEEKEEKTKNDKDKKMESKTPKAIDKDDKKSPKLKSKNLKLKTKTKV